MNQLNALTLSEKMPRSKKNGSAKLAFDIPAINNKKLALMRHLSLDGENDADYALVKELEDQGFKVDSIRGSYQHTVSVFEYENERYHVAHAAAALAADVMTEFNSSFWRIKKV